MFNIGMPELIVILVIALIVLGPKRLPELARSLGKSLNEFRRASSDLRREFLDVRRRRASTPRRGRARCPRRRRRRRPRARSPPRARRRRPPPTRASRAVDETRLPLT